MKKDKNTPVVEPVKKVKIRTKNVRLSLPHKFTDPELRQLGDEQATDQRDLRAAEESAKMVADDWKAKISAIKARITSTSNKVLSRFEHRDIPCVVTFHSPIPGRKTCVRQDTMEEVWIKDMEEHEKQEELFVEETI